MRGHRDFLVPFTSDLGLGTSEPVLGTRGHTAPLGLPVRFSSRQSRPSERGSGDKRGWGGQTAAVSESEARCEGLPRGRGAVCGCRRRSVLGRVRLVHCGIASFIQTRNNFSAANATLSWGFNPCKGTKGAQAYVTMEVTNAVQSAGAGTGGAGRYPERSSQRRAGRGPRAVPGEPPCPSRRGQEGALGCAEGMEPSWAVW